MRTTFTEEELDQYLEAQFSFATKGGTVDRVIIRLLGANDQAVIDLDYDILQLDTVVLTEFIEETAFPPEPSTQA